MPSKNILKTYIENGFYHVYNRGVEKRNIFLDEQDYRVFLSYLKIYLSPIEEIITDFNKESPSDLTKNKRISRIYGLNNFHTKISLISYVLMPNHFHLELKQTDKKDIEKFMRSLITKYTMYFNKKYKRVGHLFQSRYRAALILGEEYLIHLSKYIHQNPQELLNKHQSLESYRWSSYPAYINNTNISWIKKEFILLNFKENQTSYKQFIEKDMRENTNGGLNTSLLLD